MSRTSWRRATFDSPGSRAEYRTARNELLAAEIEPRRRTEAVAEQRLRLPISGEVPTDYAFEHWDPELDAARTLRLSACPNCTSIVDAVDAEANGNVETRHVGFIWPVWNILDRTPDGRGDDWTPQLEYR